MCITYTLKEFINKTPWVLERLRTYQSISYVHFYSNTINAVNFNKIILLDFEMYS